MDEGAPGGRCWRVGFHLLVYNDTRRFRDLHARRAYSIIDSVNKASSKIDPTVVAEALKRLAKRRVSSGNNKEQTSALFYYLAASAASKDCGASFDKGMIVDGERRELRDSFILWYKRFSQVGETKYAIVELGLVEPRDRSGENVCRANFLSTALARAARTAGLGTPYPTRPEGGQVMTLGLQIGSNRSTITRRNGWEQAMEVLLSERDSPISWTDLAIICLRGRSISKETELPEFLYNGISEVFDDTLATYWKRKISSENSSFIPAAWSSKSDLHDPLEHAVNTIGARVYTMEELKERLNRLEKHLRKLGYDPDQI